MKVKQNLKVEELSSEDLEEKPIKTEVEELTPEDEERRRRRRERNKVAATKCRNKKKEKTSLLVSEGEHLENQNHSLKQEISRLEAEKRHLVEILSLHEPTCIKRSRLEHEDDNFRVPAVPPPRGGQSSARLARQDSFLQTLEMLGSLDDITQYSTADLSIVNNQPPANEPKSEPGQDCSFSVSKPNYFLVNKPKSLSNNGFQNEQRCTLAL